MSGSSNVTLDLSITNVLSIGKNNTFKNYTFRDIGTKNFSGYQEGQQFKLNDINTSCYNDDAIKNSLRNLLNFRPGQRVLQPQYGNQLYMYLYQPMNKFTSDKIVKTVVAMIQRWQPRIVLQSTPIEANQQDNSYYIQLNYYIPMLEQQSSTIVQINRDGVVSL